MVMTIARRRILARVALAGVATLWVALPLVWVLDSSIKPRRDQYRPAVIPWHDFEPTAAHWKEHLGHPQLARALGTEQQLLAEENARHQGAPMTIELPGDQP